MNRKYWAIAIACGLAVALSGSIIAQEADPVGLTPSPDEVRSGLKKPSYSPYAGRNFPTRVYWGDTHVHTNNSLDARGFGVILGPGVA